MKDVLKAASLIMIAFPILYFWYKAFVVDMDGGLLVTLLFGLIIWTWTDIHEQKH